MTKVKETGREVTEWIHLAQDAAHCPALVNMVMSTEVSRKVGIS
jgi:hypothetical protein